LCVTKSKHLIRKCLLNCRTLGVIGVEGVQIKILPFKDNVSPTAK